MQLHILYKKFYNIYIPTLYSLSLLIYTLTESLRGETPVNTHVNIDFTICRGFPLQPGEHPNSL